MVRTLHTISSYLLIALGVVHTALTPVFYGRLSPGALWFAGSGLAMVFVGFLNVALGRGAGRSSAFNAGPAVATAEFTPQRSGR